MKRIKHDEQRLGRTHGAKMLIMEGGKYLNEAN